MITSEFYTFMVLSITGGLLTLLGAVGIFISIIVQRRFDRLQEVLEEFINLSYRSEVNLSGQMHSLIEKYQMHYLFPQKPQHMILRYIDLNIFFILTLWAGTFAMHYRPPLSPLIFIQLMPLIIGVCATLFFRRLLRDTINMKTPFLDSIIPAPVKLRSISFLSHFVNLSVKSVLKQARLSLHLQLNCEKENRFRVKVYLKEELSFDDYFHYLLVSYGASADEEKTLFVSFGEINFFFPPDPITAKPVPIRRNINVPLGEFSTPDHPGNLTAILLVFTRGEKYPVQHVYQLVKGSSFLSSPSDPEITVNHQIVYTYGQDHLDILDCKVKLAYFCELSPFFQTNGKRYYLQLPCKEPDLASSLKTCQEEVFID